MDVSRRNYTVDLIRIIAAFGVIAIHVSFSTPAAEEVNKIFTPYCVPFFYIISLTFFISRLRSTSFSQVFSKTWWRILVPYLIWTCIYVALLEAKTIISGGYRTFNVWRTLFYGESAVQLYFLPELALMQLLLFAGYLMIHPTVKNIAVTIVIMCVATGYLLIGYHYSCFGVTNPINIIVFIGSSVWIWSMLRYHTHTKLYLVIGCLLVLADVGKQYLPLSDSIFQFTTHLSMGGMGLALIAVNVEISRLPKAIVILAGTTLGIYLSHVVFLEAFEYIEPKIWSGGLYYTLATKLMVVTLIFVLSVVFTLILQHFKWTKQLFLGERN